MKIDVFEDIFPGLAVYDDETNQLRVSLDDRNFIVQGARNENAIYWWAVLPWEMVEGDPPEDTIPTTESVWDMLIGAKLVIDSESAKTAMRRYIYERIWSKARRDQTLIKDDA